MYYKQNLVLLCLIKLQLIEELIVLANNHGILINIEEDEISSRLGNKSEGLIQLSWVKGWIDASENLLKHVKR